MIEPGGWTKAAPTFEPSEKSRIPTADGDRGKTWFGLKREWGESLEGMVAHSSKTVALSLEPGKIRAHCILRKLRKLFLYLIYIPIKDSITRNFAEQRTRYPCKF